MDRWSGGGESLVPGPVCRGDRSTAGVEAVIEGVNREFETSRHSEFVEDVGQMVLDCLLTDAEKPGDLLISGRVGDQSYDLAFPLGQAQTTGGLRSRSARLQLTDGTENVRDGLMNDP